MVHPPPSCAPSTPPEAPPLPCAGCDEAVRQACRHHSGHDLLHSPHDGCWVVRIGFAEKLRSDSPCLACSYFRHKAELLSD